MQGTAQVTCRTLSTKSLQVPGLRSRGPVCVASHHETPRLMDPLVRAHDQSPDCTPRSCTLHTVKYRALRKLALLKGRLSISHLLPLVNLTSEHPSPGPLPWPLSFPFFQDS